MALGACALKEVLSANRIPKPLPAYPSAFLGRISHKLIEESAKGHLENSAGSFSKRWDELTESTEKELNGTPEHYIVPLKKSAPRYYVVRAKAIKVATKFWSPRKKSYSGIRPSMGGEISLSSKDGKLFGIVDSVLKEHGLTVLRDYKTGEILEAETNEIRPTYAAQLRLYAFLYFENFTIWPDKLELMPLSGAAFEIPVEPADCIKIAQEAAKSLDAWNAKISGISHGEDSAEVLANPSPSVCKFCQYRPACSGYLNIVSEVQDADWPADVVGTIISLADDENGRNVLKISKDGVEIVVRRLSGIERHTALATLSQGQRVGVFNLLRENAPYSFREGPNTTLVSDPKTG